VAAGLPTGSRVLPRRKPLTSREITVKFPLKRLIWPAAAIVVLLASAFFLIQILKKTGSDAAAPKVPGSVAVVAFENQTGDPKFDHLRKVIPNLLITNLENTGLFQVATWERIRDVLGQMGRKGIELIDPDSGFDFCRREGVAFIVVGSFTRAGQTFVTEFKLLDAGSRDIVSTAAERGVGEDSILNVLVDEMSRRIAGGMGVAQQKLETTHLAVADITTRSTEAYTAYLEGMEEMRKLDDAAARPLFEKAVRIDPEFAMAYLQLGRTYQREGIRDKLSAAYMKAMELSAHAPEKERMTIKFSYALRIENDRPKAVAILKDLVSRYPKEKDLRVSYGGLITRSDPDAAITEFRAALALDPNFGLALNEIAFALVQKGDYAGAQSYLERYMAMAPNVVNAIDSLGLIQFTRGRLDESIATYERARAMNPALGEELPIAYMLALKEDYDGALGWLDKYVAAVGSDAFRSVGLAWQGVINYLLGRRRLAFERLDAGLALARSSKNVAGEGGLLFIRGYLRCDQGDTEPARQDFRLAGERMGPAPAFRMAWRMGMIYADITDRAFAAAAAGLTDLEKSLSAADRIPIVEAILRGTRFLILSGQGDEKAAAQEAGKPRLYQILSPNLSFNLQQLAGNNSPVAVDGIARALAAKGRLDDALEEYRLLMTVGPETNLRRLINPLYHLRVAEIYEKKGVKAKAIEHYRKFLTFWKDADPGLPEPGQAKARLAALEGR
ncbi:MAG: tetratricopeptide repeat protein, partial [Candidatus Aminicenantales bacterium]